ncbi:MAG TPA: 50S ribosomal protein L17 [Bacteroidales bacterium]|nr:50S ribosomal protein L17 [Bacteroidales bacterium]
MRHRKGFNHLGRTSAHRKAMLSNMASSLILHKRIKTTTTKAKALRSYVEPLISRSKNDTTHSRRVVFSYLRNKYAVSELFREVSPKIMDRPGGYTRILKTGNRLGDNAEMCIIELVDYNENMLEDTSKKTKSSRRRRGSGKKKDVEAVDIVEAQETGAADGEDMQSETNAEAEATTDVEETATDDVEATTDVEEAPGEKKTEPEVKAETAASDVGEKKSESGKDKPKDTDKEEDKKE